MARIAMLALKNFPFGGHNVRKGREFSAPSNMAARFLIEAKLADFAPAAQTADPEMVAEVEAALGPATSFTNTQAAEPMPVASADPIAATTTTDAPSADAAEPAPTPVDEQPAEHPTEAPAEPAHVEPVKPRRTYRRRDMTAEGSEG
jgi:hypothetical protein